MLFDAISTLRLSYNTVLGRNVLRFSSGATQATACMQIKPRTFGYTKGKLWICLRMLTNTVANSTTNTMLQIKTTDDGAWVNLYRAKASSQYMVELECNFDTNKLNVWINGQLSASDCSLSGVNVGSFSNAAGVSVIGGNTYGNAIGFTDFYMAYDAPDDPNPTGRLGDIKIESLQVASVLNAPGYTYSVDGSTGESALKPVLNQTLSNPTTLIPAVVSPNSETAMDLTFTPPPDNTIILGVIASVMVNALETSQTGLSITYNDNKSAIHNNLNNTVNRSVVLPIDKPSSGGVWTTAEIGSAVISIKPIKAF